MMWLFVGVIEQLNLGQQVTMAAILVLAALYLIRAARVGSMAAGAVSQGVTIVVSVLVLLAVALALGWGTLDSSTIMADVAAGGRWAVETGIEVVLYVVGWVLERVPIP